MGYAGNSDPQFIFPTVIATHDATTGGSTRSIQVPSGGHLASKRGAEDLDFYIGNEALQHSKSYAINYPIRHGQIENWDHMERFWEQSIFKYLRCEPEDHYFLLVSII
jgi:actin-related protein 3